MHNSKSKGVFVTDWGCVELSEEDAKKAQQVLSADNRSSKARIEKRLLMDFFGLLAKDAFDELYA